MKDVAIIILVIITILLVLNRVVSGYTRDQANKFQGLLSPNSGIPVGKVFDVTITQLTPSGNASYTIINEILTSFNTSLATENKPQLPLFTSEAELNQVYKTAFNSSESAFSNDSIGARNKLALRLTAGAPILMISEIPSTMVTITYGTDGKPSYTDEIVQKSGKPLGEILVFGLKLLKDFHTQMSGAQGGAAIPASTLQMVNDILPSEYSKFTSGTELMNEMDNTTNPSERVKFFSKAYSIGAAYMAWLAENKWKLDLNWTA